MYLERYSQHDQNFRTWLCYPNGSQSELLKVFPSLTLQSEALGV